MKTALSDSLLQDFCDSLALQIGLHLPAERWPELWRGVCAWADASGTDPQDCVQRWLDTAPSRSQIEALAIHLTVGETYFFRDPASFDALASQVLPELIAARRAAGRRLRVWSAGCASGEEAYSLAIVLARLIPDLDRWDVQVLGTDIHPGRLAIAAQGLYEDWSFRGLSAAAPDEYFERQADGRLQVRPALRRLVSFGYLNLAEAPVPGQLDGMDLVLCRHVLMYFAPACIERVLRRMHHTLAADGWLALASIEAGRRLTQGFGELRTSGGTFFRKGCPLEPEPTAVKAEVPIETAAPALPQRRSNAEQGRLEKILAHCNAALAVDRCDAELHHLQALVHEELGQLDAARLALRRTLFLDPGRVVAHLALARLCDRQGQSEESQRHTANALALLHRRGRTTAAPHAPATSAAASIAADLLARVQDEPG